MPGMEDNVDLRKDPENALDTTEQDFSRLTQEDERVIGTPDDDNKDHEEHCDYYSCPVDISRKIPYKRKTSTEPYSSVHQKKTSPVQIDATAHARKDDNSLCATEARSLPSPLPSHFVNEENSFKQEPIRKNITFLSASNRNLEECGNIKYTSLESEIRKRSKTEQESKKVNGLGLTTLNHRENVSNSEKRKPFKNKDEKRLSALGIHEEVFECCLGDWIVTDLDLKVYEMKQAQDVTYLREKRKQKTFSLRLCRCWIS
ncbi:uncharacterized protein LOC116294111 [Actinia tenebrosa]|uniref:Uncharacterized protein LOC116294111 n=1 Tax=Actinia tenebrosa TaxID=6105 RepID=A0A6P8HQZ4_ACTTE|nr:uncharacterized protein LOC116294111 [Actinia tenebrosa]XP_031557511.1 uncharacterized protein LOC116294111 [Actinia tenebrosa]